MIVAIKWTCSTPVQRHKRAQAWNSVPNVKADQLDSGGAGSDRVTDTVRKNRA